ncbi:endonuclease domain-containing protein [Herbiconiux liangxiaofengii]|uniref:endonuclease domain-containing protein n=1 Tax=Herbiconiux liangxiaofengii TaxID=3342795 RepID=UPI0035B9111F
MTRAIRHLPGDLDVACLVAVLDSAVRERVCTSRQLAGELGTVPRLGRVMRRMDPRAESGTESVARVRLIDAGLEVEPQVRIPPYRADLVLPGRLVVEVDGREFHDTASSFESDRRRDAELARRGYRVLRLSYAQVLYDWPTCLAAVLAAL